MVREVDSLDYDGSSVDPQYNKMGDRSTGGYRDQMNLGTGNTKPNIPGANSYENPHSYNGDMIHDSFPKPQDSH